MVRSGLPTTLVICCPLAGGMAPADVETCLDFGRRSGLPVTWVVPQDRLASVADRLAGTAAAAGVALDVPDGLSRQALRALVAERAGAVDAVWIRGPLPPEHRGVLVDAGIRLACRDRFDDARASRRPAPAGWACRTTVWGLWEAVRTDGPPPGLLPWRRRPGQVPGSLAVVDVAGPGVVPEPAVLRGRIERWRSWAAGRLAAGRVRFATLSDIPDLCAGGGRGSAGGSVLRAA